MCKHSELPTIDAIKRVVQQLALEVAAECSQLVEVKRVALLEQLLKKYDEIQGPEETALGLFKFGPADLEFARKMSRHSSTFGLTASIWPGPAYRDAPNWVYAEGGNKLGLRALIWSGVQEIRNLRTESQTSASSI